MKDFINLKQDANTIFCLCESLPEDSGPGGGKIESDYRLILEPGSLHWNVQLGHIS